MLARDSLRLSVTLLHLACKFPQTVGSTMLNSFNTRVTQIRHRYDKMMWRDIKRRKLLGTYTTERIRLNAIRKNKLLPEEIKELAAQEVHGFPRDSSICRVTKRCIVTSRAKGTVKQWRMSRIYWRHLADYNKLSGVTRAWW